MRLKIVVRCVYVTTVVAHHGYKFSTLNDSQNGFLNLHIGKSSLNLWNKKCPKNIFQVMRVLQNDERGNFVLVFQNYMKRCLFGRMIQR